MPDIGNRGDTITGRIVFGPRVPTSELRRLSSVKPASMALAAEVLRDEVSRLEAALRLCIAAAGSPDAAEGCRRVIEIARGNLRNA